ncbi:ubiquitin family protein [Winogradskyella vidalii]|uniref:hypothetical protein n=1 Tax=Winogradskyella vidalii TaxID=2615024 RepID=UPI0015CA300F|nr:hypothetical protein [Winogradskyella vidalii]
MLLDKPSLKEPTSPKKRKALKDFFDFRNNQINQIGLIFFLAFVISTSLHYFFESRFDEERWKENPMKRYEMVDDIFDRELFLSNTKKEIIQQLGYPKNAYSLESDIYNYYIGRELKLSNNQIVQLTLVFKNGRVVEVSKTPSKE